MPYLDTYWNTYKENSRHDIKRGELFDRDNTISKGYEILEFCKVKEIK